MEEFFLGGFLTGNKLNIIDEEQIRFSVFTAELNIFTALQGFNQFIGELVALDIDNIGIGVASANAVGNGIQQVGLTHTGRAVNKQGVIGLTGVIGYSKGCTVGKAVGRANHEAVESELGIKVHGQRIRTFIFVSLHLLITINDDLGIRIEDFLQGIMDIHRIAVDLTTAKFCGGI